MCRFGHADLAETLEEAEGHAARASQAVDQSAALSQYQSSNDADEVRLHSCPFPAVAAAMIFANPPRQCKPRMLCWT